jgi:phosphoglycerate kinase
VGWKTLDQMELAGKKVLTRVDLNVPIAGKKISDNTRIKKIIPTLSHIIKNGGLPILVAHFGRPNGKRDPNFSFAKISANIEELIDAPLIFAADCVGTTAELAVTSQKPGGVVLLENTRFHEGEVKNSTTFAKSLARLADIYCNDAFSCAHRAHASTEAVAHLLPNCAGKLMEQELHALENALKKPQRPLAAIVGGSKVSTKLDLLNNLIHKVDTLIVGGGMANTFLLAQGFFIGASLAEHEMKDSALVILNSAEKAGCRILLPTDAVVAKEFNADADYCVVPINECPKDSMILDVGPQTVEQIKETLLNSKTVIWNGPPGAFEVKPFNRATNDLANFISKLSNAKKLVSIAGGGDTLAALNNTEASNGFSYLSTAGGAFLEWMEGKILPGIAALQ